MTGPRNEIESSNSPQMGAPFLTQVRAHLEQVAWLAGVTIMIDTPCDGETSLEV